MPRACSDSCTGARGADFPLALRQGDSAETPVRSWCSRHSGAIGVLGGARQANRMVPSMARRSFAFSAYASAPVGDPALGFLFSFTSVLPLRRIQGASWRLAALRPDGDLTILHAQRHVPEGRPAKPARAGERLPCLGPSEGRSRERARHRSGAGRCSRLRFDGFTRGW
jgi:hypothetical protein